LLTHKRHVHNN